MAKFLGQKGLRFRSRAGPSQDNIQRPRSTMARTGPAHRSYRIGMPRCMQPIAHCRPDRAARMRPLAIPARRFAGDQKDDAVTAGARAFEGGVQQPVRRFQRVPVQVNGRIWLHRPARQPTIPAAIESVGGWTRWSDGNRLGNLPKGGRRWGALGRHCWSGRDCFRGLCTRQRRHRRHHPRPKRRFVRAEASSRHSLLPATARACQQATAGTPCRVPTCHRRSLPPRGRSPRKCRRDCFP